jgi:hypothetical protein
MLKALDDELDGYGYKEWTTFGHPQLGPVEIGGWDYQFAWQNPPGPWLEEVTSRNARFVLRAMRTAPRLVIQSPVVEHLGKRLHKISAIVQNTGFLPTYVSEQGKKTGVNKPVKATLELGGDGEIVTGKREIELGHLDGRANQFESPSLHSGYPLQSRAIVEWIVRQSGGAVTISASGAKAGSTALTIDLD